MTTPSSHHRVAAHRPGADILAAMRELDPLGRRALHLIYWHNRSQAQVAADLGVPLPVVRTAVARGMRQLAQWVEGRPAASERCSASTG